MQGICSEKVSNEAAERGSGKTHDTGESQQHAREEVLGNKTDPLRILRARSNSPILELRLLDCKDVLARRVSQADVDVPAAARLVRVRLPGDGKKALISWENPQWRWEPGRTP